MEIALISFIGIIFLLSVITLIFKPHSMTCLLPKNGSYAEAQQQFKPRLQKSQGTGIGRAPRLSLNPPSEHSDDTHPVFPNPIQGNNPPQDVRFSFYQINEEDNQRLARSHQPPTENFHDLCPNCGQQVLVSDKFCANCGHSLKN